ncbi:reverse transcriptase domain-containing protein [Tanacetum coccineum]
MTGPTPDPITPSGQVITNVNNDTPNLQEQILNQLSSLKALVKLHNDTPSRKVTPIRLSFRDEPGPDPPGGPDVEELKGRDKDHQKPHKEILKSPLSRRLIEFSAPNHRTPTHLKIYDGSTDPDDHVTRFVGAANQGEWEMPVWCRMFQQTLDGPTRSWFDHMPTGSIDNWDELREKFMERFALRRRCCKEPIEATRIIRRANETLPDFKERWTQEMSFIPDVPVVMQISSFVNNSKCSELARRSTELPKGEHQEKNIGGPSRGARPPRQGYGKHQRTDNFHNRQNDQYLPYIPARSNNRRFDGRRQEVYNVGLESLRKQPKEILATEPQLQLPPCPLMMGTPRKENLDRYCDYHGEKGHYTNDYHKLKKQLEAALESGKLNHLLKDVRQRSNGRGRGPGNNGGRGKVINMVRENTSNRKRKT